MFTVNNKFEVGQEVYVIEEDTRYIERTETCDVCLGDGYFDYKGYSHRCAKCYGQGKIILDKETVIRHMVNTEPKQIASIRYMIYGKDNLEPPLKYKIHGKFVAEEMIYPTAEEAKLACERLDGIVPTLNTSPLGSDIIKETFWQKG